MDELETSTGLTPEVLDAEDHMGRLLPDAETAKRFMLAGNARVTLVSLKTGARFTYRISAPAKKPDQVNSDDVRFVSVLTGSSNESDFSFLGAIFLSDRVQIGGGHFGPVFGKAPSKRPRFVHSKKSRIGASAKSAVAFAWAWSFLARGEMPAGCEVWHEGRCGRCGRALTVPESIASGLGPECASRA